MPKYEYTPEMESRITDACTPFKNSVVPEATIEALMEEFQFPRRSITAKIRLKGFEVATKEPKAPVFNEEETAELVEFLNANHGEFTAEEVAERVAGGKFNAKQINGKVLSLELTSAVRPAEKKVAPRTYTEEEEATIVSMVESGAYIEDIADAIGKTVQSLRGKLLSMELKAPQRDKKATKTDSYENIEELAPKMTVAELAAHYDKTERGVKTVLTRRSLSAKDYTPKALKAE